MNKGAFGTRTKLNPFKLYLGIHAAPSAQRTSLGSRQGVISRGTVDGAVVSSTKTVSFLPSAATEMSKYQY